MRKNYCELCKSTFYDDRRKWLCDKCAKLPVKEHFHRLFQETSGT
jgi:hypothetical protein